MRRDLWGGWSVLRRHKKAVVCLYLSNLALASLLLFPFMEIFEQSLGPGLYRDTLAGQLDYDWYLLFQDRARGFAATFTPAVLGAGPFAESVQMLLEGRLTELPRGILSIGSLYLVFSSVVLAAAVGSFALDPDGTSVRGFLKTGAMFFGRFFRLSLLTILVFWFVKSWVVEPSAELLAYAQSQATTDIGAFGWELARYLFLAMVFLVVNMVSDYAKIKTAVENRTSVVLAFVSSAVFCRRHFLRAYGFYALILTIGVLWTVTYVGLEHFWPRHGGLALLGTLLLQQVFILGRMALKLLSYSGQMHLYSRLMPPLESFQKESPQMDP